MDEIANSSRASIEHEDLKILLPIVDSIAPKVILEVGMHRGYSMELWRKAFNPDVLIGIERDLPKEDYYTEQGDFLWGSDSHDLGTQQKVADIITTGKIDFLFIDGDHSEDGVRRDFKMYSPFVRKGGLIAFHDVVYTSSDPLSPVMVRPLWEDLKLANPYVEIRVGKNSTGIGVMWV